MAVLISSRDIALLLWLCEHALPLVMRLVVSTTDSGDFTSIGECGDSQICLHLLAPLRGGNAVASSYKYEFVS